MSTKHEIATQFKEWAGVIAGILGPLTSLIFEEKYTPKQIIARVIIGLASAAFIGGYLADLFANPKIKSLVIYLCGVGGYYLLMGSVKVFKMFGADPQTAVKYVWDIIRNTKKNTNRDETTNNTTDPNNPA